MNAEDGRVVEAGSAGGAGEGEGEKGSLYGERPTEEVLHYTVQSISIAYTQQDCGLERSRWVSMLILPRTKREQAQGLILPCSSTYCPALLLLFPLPACPPSLDVPALPPFDAVCEPIEGTRGRKSSRKQSTGQLQSQMPAGQTLEPPGY